MTIAPGPYYLRPRAIFPGSIVSCTRPALSGTVIARPDATWDTVTPEMVLVNFGGATGKIYVDASTLTVTG
jgi:hypothetical protein